MNIKTQCSVCCLLLPSRPTSGAITWARTRVDRAVEGQCLCVTQPALYLFRQWWHGDRNRKIWGPLGRCSSQNTAANMPALTWWLLTVTL